jgi:hypothetical protein
VVNEDRFQRAAAGDKPCSGDATQEPWKSYSIGISMNFTSENLAQNIREGLSASVRWVSVHIRMSTLVVVILFAVGRCAYQVWSIYDSVPDLPKSVLQMVGVTEVGARFVVLDDHRFSKGVNRISVLVVFDKLMHVKQGAFRFEVRRELVDCQKSQVQLQGAAFYDDQGRRTISRVSDQEPQPFEPVDTETTLVCDQENFAQPRVVGYHAALAQTKAAISQADVSH